MKETHETQTPVAERPGRSRLELMLMAHFACGRELISSRGLLMMIAERPHVLQETPPEKVEEEWREILAHMRVCDGDSPDMARRIALAHPGYQHFYRIQRLPGRD
jgi:hypothetical protein